MRRKWFTAVLFSAILLGSGAWFVQGSTPSDGQTYDQARLLESVIGLVADYYVDSIGEGDLYQRAARGVVEKLDDPYSVLLIGPEFRRANERSTGNYGGIGAQVDARAGSITVVATLPDSPAERAGLETGDQIVAIDDEPTGSWNLRRAATNLRGPIGTTVVLTVHRVGVLAPLTIPLTRERIHRRGVKEGIFLDRGVGYVSYDFVSENSARELSLEVARLAANGLHSLVLDLRGNPGGMRDESVAAADLFLDPGDTLLVTWGRGDAESRDFVDGFPQPWPDLRIAVLVDRQSASAAEILAGAVQDHDRGLVVGQPTFGKGLVQTQFRLAEDVALRITTARWFTPSGRSIQRADADVAGTRPSVTSPGPSVFLSSAGRNLQGGGGIVPDIEIPRDTIPEYEQPLAQALMPHLSSYRDALTSYALELKRAGTMLAESFTVTLEMRREILRRLEDDGVFLDDEMVDVGGTFIDRHLGYEIARYNLGLQAEMRRRAWDDGQLQHVLELLRQHQTTEALLGLEPGTGSHAIAPPG
ncbi:MAG: PDZ domain-containing protein [Gemmatimonadales bacterium]|nr:PDZ domain-containing protein [Gemmatimonadales bacterium]